jgi:cytochrome c oxidase subunit 2
MTHSDPESMGMNMSTEMQHGKVDPAKLQTTAPFDKPGLKQIGDNEYEAVMIAYAFGYNPDPLNVPLGAKVHFIVTSSDVVHGFEMPGTNVNFMVVPGEVTELTYTFNKRGEFLVLCNEYCGTGHDMMKTTINVQ